MSSVGPAAGGSTSELQARVKTHLDHDSHAQIPEVQPDLAHGQHGTLIELGRPHPLHHAAWIISSPLQHWLCGGHGQVEMSDVIQVHAQEVHELKSGWLRLSTGLHYCLRHLLHTTRLSRLLHVSCSGM